MSWREDLRPASFRGVPFEVLADGARLGRRQAIFEFPQLDDPLVEDMGRRARTFTVEGYVLGDDYVARRDALERACEEEGPGTLVHPSRGELQVCLIDHATAETSREGGFAGFQLTFMEAPADTAPAATDDTAVQAAAAADQAEAAGAEAFTDEFVVAGYPAFVSDAAVEVITAISAAYSATASLLNGAGDLLADFADTVAYLLDSAPTLVSTPPALAAAVMATGRAAADLAANPAEAHRALAPLAAFGPTLPPVVFTGTPSRDRQVRNQDALVTLVRTTAAAGLVRASARETFVSYQDATARRDQVAQALGVAAVEAADQGRDTAARALARLRQAAVRDITARGGSLRRLYSYTPALTEPALVIAYRLHGDAGRDGEIVTRNRIQRPGFTPGGLPLEVLTNG